MILPRSGQAGDLTNTRSVHFSVQSFHQQLIHRLLSAGATTPTIPPSLEGDPPWYIRDYGRYAPDARCSMRVTLPANSALNVTVVHMETEQARDELLVYDHSIPWLADPSYTLSEPPTRRHSGSMVWYNYTVQPREGSESNPGRCQLPASEHSGRETLGYTCMSSIWQLGFRCPSESDLQMASADY